MAEHHPRPELTDFEAQLQALKPTPGGLDRDRILFRAGRASARGPGRYIWPGVSGVLALATVALSVALATRPEPPERVVYVEVPQSAPPRQEPRPPSVIDEVPAPTPPEKALLTGGRSLMERQLLRWGLDALPAPAPAASPAQPVHHIRGVTADPPPAGTSWLNLFTFEGKGP
jgi:hypothetical protein